jgi:hypothetical protein
MANPSTTIGENMYILNIGSGVILRMYMTHISKSGDSVLTEFGDVLRTQTKYRKIFYSLDIAEFEADYLLEMRRKL